MKRRAAEPWARARRRGAGAVALSAGLLLLAAGGVAGCAGGSGSRGAAEASSRGAGEPAVDPASLEQLRSLAASQVDRPDEAVRPPEAPDWLTPEPGPEAQMPLDAVMAEAGGVATPAAGEQAGRETPWEAVRDYVHAREKLGAGDDAGAIPLLQAALRRDPDAAAVWRELGEAQLRVGRQAAAITAFQEAARRGIGEPRVLWLLGRDAARARRWQDAVRLLAQAAASAPASGDPALPLLVWADLGEALLSRGRLAAGAEAIDRATDLPEFFQASTRYRLELGELYRRRGELRLAAADARARLGRTDEALEAYATLSAGDGPEAPAAASRRVELLLRSGRSAQAGLEILGALEREPASMDDRRLALLGRLSGSAQAGPPLRRAVESLAPPVAGLEPSAASRWARIRAAAAGRDRRSVLAAHLRAMPSDEDTLRFAVNAAVDSAGAGDAASDVLGLARLVAEASPERAVAAGAIAVDAGPDPARTLALLEADGSPAGRLLMSAALLHLGMAERAAEGLAAEWPAGWEPAVLELRARAAIEAGRFDELPGLVSAAASLGAGGEERATIIAARALSLARRHAEALALLGPPPAEAPAPDAESRRRRLDRELITAELLATLGRGEEAAEALGRAAALDGGDERVRAAMLAVHAPNGPAPDQQRFAAAGRALRERVPGSRTLRWLTAQELVGRRVPGRAEPILRGLYEEDPTDRAPLGLLATVWEMGEGRSSPGVSGPEPLAWLESRGPGRQSSPAVVAARVRVLAALDRRDEARRELEVASAALPAPLWGELRERLDAGPGGPSLERLASAPRTIENTLDYAEALERAGDGKAWEALRERLPSPSALPLTPAEASRITAMASRAVQRAVSQRSAENERAALALLDEASRHDAALPLGLHQARLTFLTAGPFVDVARLAEAVELAQKQHPRPNAEWARSIASRLASGPLRAQSVRFLERVVAGEREPSAELIAEYVNAVGLFGDAAAARTLLERVRAPRDIEAILARFDAMPAEQGSPADPAARLRADLAYRLGNLAYLADDQARAAEIYRMGLELDPSHPWIANDLGYHLVETGENPAEAQTLLERAFAALPNESSVVDSLGWLRYRQSVIDDVLDGSGRVVRPGAVTLLRRAAELDLERDNATILDHLGDALWSAGRREEAIDAWTRAEALLREQVQRMRPEPGPASRLRERFASQQRTAAEKVRAARAGAEPPVAPRFGPQP